MPTITSTFDYIMCKHPFAALKSKSSVIKTLCRSAAQGGRAAVGTDDA
jgi:hypothetical protein